MPGRMAYFDFEEVSLKNLDRVYDFISRRLLSTD